MATNVHNKTINSFTDSGKICIICFDTVLKLLAVKKQNNSSFSFMLMQRTFVGVDSFSVFQEVYLQTDDPRVSNIVKFSDTIGELKVEVCHMTMILSI